jgi:thiol-disulfide isomerase/thioredoxin|tara:strand:- start:1397 stop:1759 length:363 start_codon:yes stop_codon:yes gene_type:complete
LYNIRYEKLFGIPNNCYYIDDMNEVIILKEDNLKLYIEEDQLVVFFSKNTCPACLKLLPDLYYIPKEFTVVVVDSEKHLSSNLLFPGGIKYYPTIAYYEKGYYKDEFKLQNLNQYKQKYK